MLKKIFPILSIVALCSSAWGGDKDLALYNGLVKFGIEVTKDHSVSQISLTDVNCFYHRVELESRTLIPYFCNFKSVFTKPDGTPEIHSYNLEGERAMQIFNMLAGYGAPTDSGMGSTFLAANQVACIQYSPGAENSTAAVRTMCDVQL
jgi:hypothetical protein